MTTTTTTTTTGKTTRGRRLRRRMGPWRGDWPATDPHDLLAPHHPRPDGTQSLHTPIQPPLINNSHNPCTLHSHPPHTRASNNPCTAPSSPHAPLTHPFIPPHPHHPSLVPSPLPRLVGRCKAPGAVWIVASSPLTLLYRVHCLN